MTSGCSHNFQVWLHLLYSLYLSYFFLVDWLIHWLNKIYWATSIPELVSLLSSNFLNRKSNSCTKISMIQDKVHSGSVLLETQLCLSHFLSLYCLILGVSFCPFAANFLVLQYLHSLSPFPLFLYITKCMDSNICLYSATQMFLLRSTMI